jgi:hypothetical protein
MPARRRAWIALESDYERIKEMEYPDIDFGDLFEVTEYSESDARAIIEKYEVDEVTAQVLATAQRAFIFCNVDPEYRRLAKTLEIDVVDAEEFVKRFTDKKARRDEDATPPSPEAPVTTDDGADTAPADAGPTPPDGEETMPPTTEE